MKRQEFTREIITKKTAECMKELQSVSVTVSVLDGRDYGQLTLKASFYYGAMLHILTSC